MARQLNNDELQPEDMSLTACFDNWVAGMIAEGCVPPTEATEAILKSAFALGVVQATVIYCTAPDSAELHARVEAIKTQLFEDFGYELEEG